MTQDEIISMAREVELLRSLIDKHEIDPQRVAMQMALEALRGVSVQYDFYGEVKDQFKMIKPAITALREALAQPQDKSDVEHYRAIKKRNAEVVALEKAQPQGEPVAWAYIDADGSFMDALNRQHGAYQTPLYITPPSVEDAIAEAYDKGCADGIDITKSQVEAAIEATKEKAAKVCEGIRVPFDMPTHNMCATDCAAAIRSMK